MTETTNGATPAEEGGTKYRVIQLLSADGEITLPDGETLAVETYALLPDTFEGNAIKAAHAKYGDGSYAKFPARGFELKSARVEAVVKIG